MLPVETTPAMAALLVAFAAGESAYFASRLLLCRRRGWLAVGAAMAVLTILVALPAAASSRLLPYAALAAMLAVAGLLVAIDLRLMIIPDVLAVALLAAGAAYNLSQDSFTLIDAVLGMTVGAAMLGGPMMYYRRMRGIAALGLGDVKLMAAIGAISGPTAAPMIVVVGSLATLALAALCYRREAWALARLPFAPGLLAGLASHLMASLW